MSGVIILIVAMPAIILLLAIVFFVCLLAYQILKDGDL